LRSIFSFQDISSGQLYYVLFGTVLLSLYIFDLETLYEYERTSIYNFYYHIYDGPDIGAGMSDEI